jgi:maltooligosyltrehalose trehalohydrolase
LDIEGSKDGYINDMKKMGAIILDRAKAKVEFRVFAHDKEKISLLLQSRGTEKCITMNQEEEYVYSTVVEGLGLDLLYKFRIENEGDFPDPYSHFQPQNIHGFSQVIDHQNYSWKDPNWRGRDLEESIIYELHVGTFTQEGTFQAAAKKLDYLMELGVNTIELLPVVQTPGRWNWGYDGTNLFSVNVNYGSPDDLKAFIDTCHQKDTAVILDVVYNHFGPEGVYLPSYGPYFTDKYDTPWGVAVNYDDQFCEFTRAMVLENVRFWLEDYHIDGLRLDAVHAIRDESGKHILLEISKTTKQIAEKSGRKIALIAETDENDVKLINSFQKDGYGIDAQWMDDFHHVIHSVLTGENDGYYVDYGHLEALEKVFKNYLYTGEYSVFWQKDRGTDAGGNPGRQFVVSMQNHDQVGNRAGGERLSSLVDFPFLKAVAGLLFFSPYIPLIFMGEEYGEKKPFLFFTDYLDPELQSAVTEGRREEFSSFNWDNFPDPQDEQTYYRSKLTPRQEWKKENDQIFHYYCDLINLRKSHSAISSPDKEKTEVKVDSEKRTVEVTRWSAEKKLIGLFNLGENDLTFDSGSPFHLPRDSKQIFNSEWQEYGGNVDGESKILFRGNMIILESLI